MIKKPSFKILLSSLLVFSFAGISFVYGAATSTTATTTDTDIEALKAKIEDRNAQIKQLEDEINTYNNQADQVGDKAKTLQNTLKILDITQKKISTDINLTQQKISKTSLTIDEISNEINATESSIQINEQAIQDALRAIQSLDDSNIFSQILARKDIKEIWNDVDNVQTVRDKVREKTKELEVLKQDLEDKQNSQQTQKKNLVNLKQDLSGKKQAVLSSTQEKAALLAQTKNQEQLYRQLVQTKEDLKAQFEKEVFDYESQLNITVDTSKYPSPKHGILSWPLDKVFVTQKFGKTVGASRLYASGTHNGVDFRASIGTRVKNVLDGVVVGTGNTDTYPGCYSFGKWVMVKHGNGLSTIYAHLSVISATVGQNLSTGDLIGYSGNTGYSTGPHLHISEYATEGVRIEKFVNSHGCKQVVIPLADIKAYLDPLAYFPVYN